MGAVIEGASVAFIAGLRLINDGIDKVKPALDKKGKKQNMIESFLKFKPGEFRKLGTLIGNELDRFLENSEDIDEQPNTDANLLTTRKRTQDVSVVHKQYQMTSNKKNTTISIQLLSCGYLRIYLATKNMHVADIAQIVFKFLFQD